jgi:zinc transporter 1
MYASTSSEAPAAGCGHSHKGGHSHAHSHGPSAYTKKATLWYQHPTGRKLGFFTSLIACMFLLELVGGIRSGSLALVSDAFHMLSDGMSLIIALMCLSVSQRASTDSMSFGWERAEILGGLINAVVLITVCGFIVIEAVTRLVDPPVITEPSVVIAIGCVSLVFNCCGIFMFHQGGHSHSHGGVEHHEDMNVKAIFLHILGDALASLAVIVSGLIIQFSSWEFRYRVDPFVSMGISAIILSGTIPLVKRASRVLMQATPGHIDPSSIKRDIQAVPGVVGLHHLHVWQLYKDKVVASVHLNLEDNTKLMDITTSVQKVLHKHGAHSSTIQTELRLQGCAVKCGPPCAGLTCCSRPQDEPENLSTQLLHQIHSDSED